MQEIRLPNGTWKYDPDKPLGPKGGFGQVFAGTSADGQKAAVKRLSVTAEEAGHREIEIAECLLGREFKNVVPILDAGEDAESGSLFVVMTKAECSLQDRLDSVEAFDPAETANIMLQAVQGLQEAGNIVHRDLKPGNLLAQDGVWKIADFGIARFVERVTSSNTVKECLTPLYAAPEQFRGERATRATDLYSLGCIGYTLLTGTPPFTDDPQEQHQFEQPPHFACEDARLRSLVLMMLRKLPESRPSIERVISRLDSIATQPDAPESISGSLLADVSAAVAERDAAQQAAKEAKRSALQKRRRLFEAAIEILHQNCQGLWDAVDARAPNAVLHNIEDRSFSCSLGFGELAVEVDRSADVIQEGVFQHSGWDVVVFAQLLVEQSQPRYSWPSALFYASRSEGQPYRWHEVLFFGPMTGRGGLIDVTDYKDIDFALSRVTHSIACAFGPVPIDDEHESEFHERCIWLLAQAANGNLKSPSSLPIRSWPPHL